MLKRQFIGGDLTSIVWRIVSTRALFLNVESRGIPAAFLPDSMAAMIREMTVVQAYSGDLRSRVIKAAADGMSARQAAARFGVGVSTAIVWVRRFRANGEATARRQGKPRGSRLDAHADFILALVEAGTKDISLAEIVERLEAERGVRVGITSVWKVLDRHGLTYKKRLLTPPSRIARTYARRGRSGSTTSSTSIPTS